jgi:hypothetical protein
MRRSTVLAVCALVAGCHAEDVAPPVLQRPISALPPGPRTVLLANDLANTWRRVETHDVRALFDSLSGFGPGIRSAAVDRIAEACRAIEAETGVSMQEDVVLNALGGRAGIGLYASEGDTTDIDVLLVAELRDPARFQAAVGALSGQVVGPVRVATDTFDGAPSWRLSDAEGTVVHVVQQEALLVAASSLDLVRAALALHAGGDAGATALQEPAIASALAAIGPHNVVTISPHPQACWSAQAFTWDDTGLHFDHLTTLAPGAGAAGSAAKPSPARRDAILGAIPDGMTLAAYVHSSVLDRLDPAARGGGGATPGPDRGLAGFVTFLPSEVTEWCGDEIGIALRGVEPTAMAPVPDVAFVLSVRDAVAAEAGLRALEQRLAQLPIGPAAAGFEDVEYGGRTFRSLVQPLAEGVSPSWMLDGDIAVIATTRTLMQQIVDARRTGRRTARSDRSFQRFRDFVPPDAGAVVYADQKRLRRVTQELERSASLWGPKVEQGVATIGRLSTLLEHFPAGAAYATHDGDQLAVRGWMLEGN